MGRLAELGIPLAIIALLGWATWPPQEFIILGWYLLLFIGAVAVVVSVVAPADWRERPAPILAGIALTITVLILAYAALRPIAWEEWVPWGWRGPWEDAVDAPARTARATAAHGETSPDALTRRPLF
jgi:hypothetical protein